MLPQGQINSPYVLLQAKTCVKFLDQDAQIKLTLHTSWEISKYFFYISKKQSPWRLTIKVKSIEFLILRLRKD